MIAKARNLTLAAVLTAGAMAGAVLTAAIQTHAQSPAPTGTPESDKTVVVKCECRAVEEHWTKEHIQAFQAEQNLEQGIYLAAVQAIRMEQARGDVRKAIPILEDIVKRSPKQPLKNAVRRLLIEISLETPDHIGFKEAEGHLKAIVDESLLQF